MIFKTKLGIFADTNQGALTEFRSHSRHIPMPPCEAPRKPSRKIAANARHLLRLSGK
jgi:hypothetical protein